MALSRRLALSHLAVVVLGMGIAAPLAWLTVERLYLDAQKANLLAQAQLAAAVLQGSPEPAQVYPPYSQSSNMAPGIHTWVIVSQGAVVVYLPSGGAPAAGPVAPLPPLAQNSAGNVSSQELLARPEISQALAGKATTAIRTVDVGGQRRRILYAAAPVSGPDAQVTRIVYVTSPLPDADWQALPPATRWQLAGALILALALAGVFGWALSEALARPLRRLAGAARAVAAGDLGQAVPESGPAAELRTLGHAFNQMTTSLRQADLAKTAFVADVSHELRTPLTVIKGAVETLQDGAVDDVAARTTFLNSMASETERLIRLVNDLLVLTRADAGALKLQLQPVALDEVARARAANLAVIAGPKHVLVDVAPSAGPVLALADPYRVAQILDNLIENAVRYSPSGSRVLVSFQRSQGEWRCAVTDTGPGVAARHIPYIFDRFYRGDASRSRASGGSGLGLAITRALVQAQGGRISVESREGAGATFTFSLPAAPNCP
jgi:two-component system sensor histidine kinase BaeS